MAFRSIEIDNLEVNPANDRHGELENETAAIGWLFSHKEEHMKNLAKDVVSKGGIYDAPLVAKVGERHRVFDGNRRVTCLKLLANPARAPNQELKEFFLQQKAAWSGPFPNTVMCQVEVDQDRIDEILFRRHTGSQSGVGQSTWDDRMKQNFVLRTGKSNGPNVADEIERRLAAVKYSPSRQIPRSTLSRLLSAELFRNRVGISLVRGKFSFTHDEGETLLALRRIAGDLATRKKVLGDLWDTTRKTSYLDELEQEGILPKTRVAAGAMTAPSHAKPAAATPRPATKPSERRRLIQDFDHGIAWKVSTSRQKAIWEELQFELLLASHINAISVLFRVLLELSVEHYIGISGIKTINPNDKLAQRAVKVATHLHAAGKIDAKYLSLIQKLPNQDKLFSMDTLNRYVHSSDFAPSPKHLTAMWDTAAEFVVNCLNA